MPAPRTKRSTLRCHAAIGRPGTSLPQAMFVSLLRPSNSTRDRTRSTPIHFHIRMGPPHGFTPAHIDLAWAVRAQELTFAPARARPAAHGDDGSVRIPRRHCVAAPRSALCRARPCGPHSDTFRAGSGPSRMLSGRRQTVRQHFSLEGFASRLVEPRAELLYLVLEKYDLREADQFAIDPDR